MAKDNIIGLVYAIMANIAFVANSAVVHIAMTNQVDYLGLLLVGSLVKYLIAHAHLKYMNMQYELSLSKNTGLVLLC